MATICCGATASLTLGPIRIHVARCCSSAPDNGETSKRETPRVLKVAVSGATELLRLFSSFDKSKSDRVSSVKQGDGISVSSVDDVVKILKADYENAYFVTGNFTSEVYADDCIFEDPTIRFKGKELYSRNLKLLVPFFDCPSIVLQKTEKVVDSATNFVLATWKLRTYLKLPWRPLISIDGSTLYQIDDEFKIVRHAESWNVSAFEAVGQIFTASFGRAKD